MLETVHDVSTKFLPQFAIEPTYRRGKHLGASWYCELQTGVAGEGMLAASHLPWKEGGTRERAFSPVIGEKALDLRLGTFLGPGLQSQPSGDELG